MRNVILAFIYLFGFSQLLAGLILCFAPFLPFLADYATFLVNRFGAHESEAELAPLFLLFQFYGPLLIAWSLLFLSGVTLYLIHGFSLLKNALLASIAFWLILDGIISIIYGLNNHLFYNVPILIGLSLALIWIKPSRYRFYKPGFRDEWFLNKRILVTGGSGFIGKSLCYVLIKSGAQVTILTRQSEKAIKGLAGPVTLVKRLDDISSETPFDYVINLAGEPIASQRWSAHFKSRLINSRVQMTLDLSRFIERLSVKPEALVNASAIGYYGDQGEALVDESTHPKDCFSHQLCQQWEEQAWAVTSLGVRVSIARIGIVLGRYGGTLAEFNRSMRFKVAVQMGSGKQWFSWIHIDDALRALLFLCRQGEGQAYNLTAPEPISHTNFVDALARQNKAWLKLKLPVFILRKLFGELADELFLSSANIKPQRLSDAEFVFEHATLEGALEAIKQR